MDRDNFLVFEYQREIDKYHRLWWDTGCTAYKLWADGYITMLQDLQKTIQVREKDER